MDTLARTHNSTFAIGGVSCSADNFVVTESLVLRMNICAEKPTNAKPETVIKKKFGTRLFTLSG